MATLLNVEAATVGAAMSSANSQMAPVVTGGSATIANTPVTNWPLEGKTRYIDMVATSTSGGVYGALSPASPSGGWEALNRFQIPAAPTVGEATIIMPRSASAIGFTAGVTTAGTVVIRNAANALVGTSPALTLPGVFYFGWFVLPDASVGKISFKIWNHIGTELWSIALTAQNTGSAALTNIRVGAKCGSSTNQWPLLRVGQMELISNNATALTLTPPISDPVAASHVTNGWVYDDSTDTSAGTLNISLVDLTPDRAFVVDQANRRIAVEATDEPATYSYRVTNAATSRYITVNGSVPAAGGTPSAAMLVRKIGGVLVEVL